VQVPFHKFDQFVADLAHGVHRLHVDVLKVLLTDRAPVRTDTVRADLAEIASGHGYTPGGHVAALLRSGQTAGVYTLTLQNPAPWVASGGSMGPLQHAVLYNATAAGEPLIGWFAYVAAITLRLGQVFLVELDAAEGVLSQT